MALLNTVFHSMRGRVVLSALMLLASSPAVSQCGLAGVVIEEVPIPADLASQIAADAGFVNEPKCWRVYLCFLESGFRVFSLYSPNTCEAGPNLCWTADCPDCTGDSKFYQHPFGSFFGHLVPGAVIPFEPLLAFDSWWSIGEPYNLGAISGYSLPNATIVEFDTEGGVWNPGANASISVALGFQNADAQRRVLIGQFTTDGTLSGSASVIYSNLTFVCPETGGVALSVQQLVSFSTDPGFEQTCACDLEVTPGCVNSDACNYDPLADCESGECILPGDPCNDGSNFTVNDTVQEDCSCLGVPMVQGCTSEPACNYNPDANSDDGSCFIVGDSCSDGNNQTVNDTVQEDCSCAGVPAVFGCTEEPACNYNPDANVNNGTCVFIGDPCDDADPLTINDSIKPDCSCLGVEEVIGCTAEAACNFNPQANADDSSCVFVGDPCDDGDPLTINDTIKPDCTCSGDELIEACSNADACNFNPLANIDDASCIFPGDSCDDGNPATANDVITENCTCEGTVSIDEEALLAAVQVFPNPATSEVVIDLGQSFMPVMATLTDVSGRIVMSQQITGRGVLRVDAIASGMYVLMLETTDARSEVRVMVQH